MTQSVPVKPRHLISDVFSGLSIAAMWLFGLYAAVSVIDALITTHANPMQALMLPFKAIICLLLWIACALTLICLRLPKATTDGR